MAKFIIKIIIGVGTWEIYKNIEKLVKRRSIHKIMGGGRKDIARQPRIANVVISKPMFTNTINNKR